MALMQKVKQVFNHNELCNPGKLFPTSKSCVETKWRPKTAYV